MTALPTVRSGRTIGIGVPIDTGPHRDELLAALGYAIDARGGRVPPFRLVMADDRRAAGPATSAAMRLLDAGVAFVIGHFSASAALAAAPIYERAGIFFFAPGTTHPDLTGHSRRLVFRVCGRDTDQAAILGAAIKRLARGAHARPLVVSQATPYGRSMGRLLCESLTACDLEPRHWEYRPDDSGLRPPARDSVIAIAGAHDFIARIAVDLRNRGHRGPFVASDDAYSDRLLTLAGGAVEGLRVPVLAAGGDCAHRLAQRFERDHGRRPGAFFLTSYVAANIILESSRRLRAAGAEIVAASIRRRAWHTPFGRLSFRAGGEPQGFRWTMRQVVNGRFVPESPGR
jgi:branched-chain amino acid transport system substrate-binding protein